MKGALPLVALMLVAPVMAAFAEDEAEPVPTFDVDGVVVGTNAGPLSRATLLFYRHERPENGEELSGKGRHIESARQATSVDGTFRAEGLPDGLYKLRVIRHDRRATVGPFDPMESPWAVEVDVGGVIRGHVLAEDGGGVPGLRVQAVEAKQRKTTHEDPWSAGDATTDIDGAFVITDLARHRLHRLTTGTLPSVTRLHERARTADTISAHSDGPPVRWEVDVKPGLDGVIVDVAGDPVTDAKVYVVDHTHKQFGTAVAETLGRHAAVTNRDGRFRVVPVPHGRYRVGVRVGYMPNALLVEGGADVVAPRRDLRFVVELGGEISGRVVGPDGEPVGATVWAFPSDPARPYRQTATGVDGNFTLTGLDARFVYDVAVYRPGLAPVEVDAARVGTSGLDVTLPRGLTVAGRVVRPDGTPVANAPLSVWPAPRQEARGQQGQEGETDADGRFTVTGLVEGEVHVQMGVADSRTRTIISGTAITTAGDEDVELIVTVERY